MTSRSTTSIPETKSNKKTPNWGKSTSGKSDLYTFVEIPIKYEHKITPTFGISNNPNTKPIANQQIIDASFDRLIIYKDKNGKINERIISFVPDEDYLRIHKGDISHNKIDNLDEDFFGYLHYKDWEGNALFVLRIEKGKAVKKYNILNSLEGIISTLNSTKISNEKVMVVDDGGYKCYFMTWDWYQDCYYATPESEFPYFCDPVVIYNLNTLEISCPTTGGGGGPSNDPPECLGVLILETGECIPDPPTPCDEVKKLTQNATFRAKFKLIEGYVTGAVENAFVFKFSDNSYSLRVGDASSVDPNITTPVDGFFHNHRTDVGHYATFDMYDVGIMYKTYADGNIINVNTFVTGIATQYGTYILKIENESQFSTYGNTNLSNNTKIETIQNTYDDYLSTAMFTLSFDQKKATEYALLKAIEGSGLMLFKGNSNLTSWQAIKENSNNVINTNCDFE